VDSLEFGMQPGRVGRQVSPASGTQ
jgi:hypothetical protein